MATEFQVTFDRADPAAHAPSGPRRGTMFRRRRHQRRVHRHAGPRGQRVPPRL